MAPDSTRASHGLAFHHPLAFGAGCALIITGGASHMPMFMMGRHTHWQMVGMTMDAWMLWGMAMIPAGVLLAGVGLMPRLELKRESPHGSGHLCSRQRQFHVADRLQLTERKRVGSDKSEPRRVVLGGHRSN